MVKIFAHFRTTIQGLDLQQILSMWSIGTQSFWPCLTPGFGDESKEECWNQEQPEKPEEVPGRSSKCFSHPLFLIFSISHSAAGIFLNATVSFGKELEDSFLCVGDSQRCPSLHPRATLEQNRCQGSLHLLHTII